MPVTASSCMYSYIKRKQYLPMGKLHLTILTDHANICSYMCRFKISATAVFILIKIIVQYFEYKISERVLFPGAISICKKFSKIFTLV